MKVDVQIKGLDSLTKKLRDIEEADIESIMNKAVLIVEAQAKALAPVDRGQLRSSIHAKVENANEGIIYGRVYTSAEHAMYNEFGTGIVGQGTYPYEIKGVTLSYRQTEWIYPYGEVKKGKRKGQQAFRKTRGMEARPFMYPALSMNKDRINKLFRQEIQRILKTISEG